VDGTRGRDIVEAWLAGLPEASRVYVDYDELARLLLTYPPLGELPPVGGRP